MRHEGGAVDEHADIPRTAAPGLTGSPRMRMLPRSGRGNPTTIRMVEVLPASLGLSSAQISPREMVKPTSVTAGRRP
jgi:hypothetical protein